MYTNQDLEQAVTQKIFTENSVSLFKKMITSQKNIISSEEENFKLLNSLNDIFVVIASSLLLFSVFWFTGGDNIFSYILFSSLSWGLSEIFVRKKKMALPGIVLLIYFVGGIFLGSINQMNSIESSYIAFLFAAIASATHWMRFHVPITVSAGIASLIGLIISGIIVIGDYNFFDIISNFWIFTLPLGIIVFFIAMYWDSSDRKRETYKSDVAFWLHLLAAPLIIHSVFVNIAVETNSLNIFLTLFLYILLTMLSLALNRKIFMISSLIYVLFALAQVLNKYGSIDYMGSLSGIVMGGLLLGISMYWHESRKKVLSILPLFITKHLPFID